MSDHETLWDLVDAEARRDWLDQRDLAPDERPDPREYEDLEPDRGWP